MKMASFDKRILVSGATGFVGANLVREALEKGAEVHVITRPNSNKWRLASVLDSIYEHHADISQYRQIDAEVRNVKPDIVFHTAAYGTNPHENGLHKMYDSNVIGTANLLKAVKKLEFELFVNTGSSSEYGLKDTPMKENASLEPISEYGKSKAAATILCQSCAQKYNLPIVTLRLFSPYGYFEDRQRLIPSVALSCLRRENPKISSTSFVRDFVFIEDVLAAYMSCDALSAVPGEVFNIGSGQQHTVGDVVNTIIQLTGANVTPQRGHPQKWPHEPPLWQADISKAREMLDWSPSYDLHRGLAATVEWLSTNAPLYE
jgi:nucleoside-diphosphate-sugar epimerase